MGKVSGALVLLALLISTARAAPEVEGNRFGRTVKLATVDVVLSADGSYVSTVHAETRAENAAVAMSLGQTSIAYNTTNQSLEILEAYTLKADGRKLPVDVSAIYDQLPPGMSGVPMFTDEHTKTIIFPQLSAKDVAVYTARITTKRAIFPGQFWFGEDFPRQVAFDEVRETLTAPKDLPLSVESHDVGFEKTLEGGQMVYRWHYSAPAAASVEPVAVSPLAHVPRFFVSTFPNYAALGRAYADAAAAQSAVTPSIQSLADSIAEGTSDRREVARRLYEWVLTHIRYVAIELGRGSLVPHAADTIVSNGYGDCKDHVALLAALLKAKGIDSEGVLINAGSSYVLTDAPTFTDLNHIITYIPSLNIYLDSTALVAPFGALPFEEYGKPVVYTSRSNPREGQMPVLPPGQASVFTKTASRLSKEGVLTGTTTTTATGSFSIGLRLIGLGIQTVGPQAAAKQLLAANGFDSNASGSLDAPTPMEPSDSYAVTGTFSTDTWTREAAGNEAFHLPGGMRILGLSGDGLMGSFGGTSLKPDADIACFTAIESEDLSLEAPLGEQFSSVPPDTHVKTPYLSFDAHWALIDRTIGVHREFKSRFDQPLCTAAVRTANAKALDEISDSYNAQLSLEAAAGGGQGSRTSSQFAEAPVDSTVAAMFADAQSAVLRGDSDAAIVLLSNILSAPNLANPTAFEAHYDRAVLYFRRWRVTEALADLDAALVLSPKATSARLVRARLNYLTANWSLARADCDAVLASEPTNPQALHVRANIEIQTAAYQDAIRDYSAELKDINDTNARVLRAVAFYRTGRGQDAESDIKTAEELGDKLARSDFDSIIHSNEAAPSGPNPEAPVWWSQNMQSSHFGAPAASVPYPDGPHSSYFPPLVRRLEEEGRAIVEFMVGADGTISDPKIERSSGFPLLDAAAIESVKSWRYRPAERDGKPVSMRWRAEVKWEFDPISATANNAGAANRAQ